jgi:DNA polymerase-3 subunit delta
MNARSKNTDPPAAPAATRAFLVFGEDEYRVSGQAHKLVDELCPEADRALGLETIDGAVDLVAEAIAALGRCLDGVRTVGFFGARKVVWLKNASFLADTPAGRSEEVKTRLQLLGEEIKNGLPAGNVLLISAGKVDGRSSFYKVCKAHARLFPFALPEKAYQLEQYARDCASGAFREQGLRASGEVLDLFIQTVGHDSRQIANEAAKLKTYLRDRPNVEARDIHEIASASRESLIWDLTDALGEKDWLGAMRILRNFFFHEKSSMSVLFPMEGAWRLLLIMRLALDRRGLRLSGDDRFRKAEWVCPPEAEEAFAAFRKDPRQMHPYRLAKLAAQAGRFTEQELVGLYADTVAAHERVVTSSMDSEWILEMLLLRFIGRAGSPAAAPAG